MFRQAEALRGQLSQLSVSERGHIDLQPPSVASDTSGQLVFDELPTSLRAAMAVVERRLISDAIVSCEGRMEDVAERLGIGRRTLNEKIVKLGIQKAELLAN